VKVLVTGGAGFVGSHVVERLVGAGCAVTVLDRADPVSPFPSGVVHVRGDVRRADDWREVTSGDVDAVCHLAAKVGLGVDFADAPAYVDDNDHGTATGLAVLHERRFRGRIVLASSMVVYGEGGYRCRRHGVRRARPRTVDDLAAGRFDPPCPDCGRGLVPVPVDEDAPTAPRNVYAATKLHQEHLAAAFGAEHGVPVARLRFHNVYGPRMPVDTPYAGVASIFRSALAAGRPPRVFEDGRQRRDFVHVDDVARATALAVLADEPVDEALNVASGEPRTVLELASAMAAAFGVASGAPLAPVVVGGGRPGDVRHIMASPVRARERLGFRAERSFADGVAELVHVRASEAA
jgi:dTDP-L-rhamnose 4-epimerase